MFKETLCTYQKTYDSCFLDRKGILMVEFIQKIYHNNITSVS
jgi:hypothetical protein